MVAFRVAEAFGHERAVAVFGKPLAGQFAQAQTETLGSEVGPAGFPDDEKPAQLHDEFEALGAGDRVPADDGVAILEMPGGGAPDEHGDNLVFFENELAEAVSRLAPGTEQVFVVQQGMGDLPVGGGFGGADSK